jgi:prepilin-type N-terminal cleavage/methylation domain-containing protein
VAAYQRVARIPDSGRMQMVGRGFTLIELLIVAAIIAALLAIMVPAIGGIHVKAAQTQTTAILGSIQTGLQQYYSEFNMYPPSGPAYGGIPANRGSVMLAQGLLGFLGGGADGAGPDTGDPTYGFRTKRMGAGMGGVGGQIYGPYVPTDSKTLKGASPTMYFVDAWGGEILYYRSTRSVASASAAPVKKIFGTGGGNDYYFDYADCSGVAGASGPGSGTAKFFGQLGSTNKPNPNDLSNASATVMGAASYLLISAGTDGKYFTDDDIVGTK